ncbi:hypothetical protein C8R43DRAFT_1024985 [Mycena crocata]|nr:hypothetical protein C8R43DRAFT_1024985 [Mycena crocata]
MGLALFLARCQQYASHITRKFEHFTRDQDSLLIGYIAEYNPGSPGRCGNKLYQRLVENVSVVCMVDNY